MGCSIMINTKVKKKKTALFTFFQFTIFLPALFTYSLDCINIANK